MRYLLDSNTCIELIRRRGNRSVKRRLMMLQQHDVAISTVSTFELLIGARHKNAPRDEPEVVEYLLEHITILPLEEMATRQAVEAQALLEANGFPISTFDALIAGTALAHHLILVTHNTSEFARVPGLRIEDWQR